MACFHLHVIKQNPDRYIQLAQHEAKSNLTFLGNKKHVCAENLGHGCSETTSTLYAICKYR